MYDDEIWVQGYNVWMIGHQYWVDHQQFPANCEQNSNPFEPETEEYREWSSGWNTALEDYLSIMQ